MDIVGERYGPVDSLRFRVLAGTCVASRSTEKQLVCDVPMPGRLPRAQQLAAEIITAAMM